ncbi:DcaP family trimeric outer membrane transporter [Marinobacter halotolerans]|uniref:DcaP family trimeric outer membrane transporter n=1 Tax=Marinobacter halotolerans TaxID=1569211 RepID=UPI001CD9C906|nr:DcaP family trimeric outer membrane transporter [Marinobacter halotolerans]
MMTRNKLGFAIGLVLSGSMASQAMAVELSTGDYKTSLYGFARFAAAYDMDEDISAGGRAGQFNAITVGNGNTSDGHFGADATGSRLGLVTTSPEGVTVRVEMDFDRDGTITPRLRRAYGEYNGVLMGQEWSNFHSFVGNPSILDWDNLPGRAGLQSRITQARYTTGPLSFSVEDDTSRGSNNIANAAGDKVGLPVFTARLEDGAGGMKYSVGALLKQVSYDDATGTGNDDSALGFATFLAGNIALTDMFSVMGSVSYSDGAANYIYRSGENFGGFEAYADANGDLETITTYGANIGAKLSLGGGRSINLGYGTTMKDLDDAVAANAAPATTAESNSMLAVNYQWSPVSKVNMGVEFARLSTENQNGDDGDANRLMFVGQYNF